VNEPKKAYVVMDHIGNPHFSAPTFDRAMERATALMHSQKAEAHSQISYRIVEVEGE